MRELLKRLPVIGPAGRAVMRGYRRLGAGPMPRPTPEPFKGSADFWERRYATGGNSGPGSYNELASFKAEVLNGFVEENGVRSVIEFGCGDGNQLGLARYPHYIGVDVSPSAVALCRERFAGDPTKAFLLADNYAGEAAELALSLDVIFHLVEDDIFSAYLRRLFDSSTKYVIIYSSNTDANEEVSRRDYPQVRHRRFTDWVGREITGWRLVRHIPNRYPWSGDSRTGSFADFYVYERVEVPVGAGGAAG